MDLVFTIATCGLHVCPATAEVQAASCGFYAGAGSAVPATAAATVYVCVRESAYVCACVWVSLLLAAPAYGRVQIAQIYLRLINNY